MSVKPVGRYSSQDGFITIPLSIGFTLETALKHDEGPMTGLVTAQLLTV